jgi:hypothetical protein
MSSKSQATQNHSQNDVGECICSLSVKKRLAYHRCPVHVTAVPICCHCCESSPIWHHGTLQSIHYISNLPIWEV